VWSKFHPQFQQPSVCCTIINAHDVTKYVYIAINPCMTSALLSNYNSTLCSDSSTVTVSNPSKFTCWVQLLHFTSLIPLIICLCPATVIFGFQQIHYKVNEDERCVSVLRLWVVSSHLLTVYRSASPQKTILQLVCCCFVDALKQPAIEISCRKW